MFQKIKEICANRRNRILLSTVFACSVLTLALFPAATQTQADATYLLSEEDTASGNTLNVFLRDEQAELIAQENGSELALTAGLAVRVTYQGKTISALSEAETVGTLLARMEIETSPLEMVVVEFGESSVTIEIGSEFIFYEHINTVTEHEVIYQYVEGMPDWYENVLQVGADGVHSEIYEIIYQDGVETGRHLIDTSNTEPVTAIIEKGTIPNFANHDDAVASITTNEDGSGIITLENGQTVTFHASRTMKATAYSSEEPGLSNRTATGTATHVGVVAVDKNVIPLGSKLYIVSNDGYAAYGFAVAEDTGVRGNRVDLYMDTVAECLRFGVRNCTVYILD